MPYVAALRANAVIRDHHTGAAVHIQEINRHHDGAQALATLAGHLVNGGGILYRVTVAANLYVIETALPGALVEYHGSNTARHGRYRVAGPCQSCATCADDLNGHRPRYRLDDGTPTGLAHVRHPSITVIRPACHVCY